MWKGVECDELCPALGRKIDIPNCGDGKSVRFFDSRKFFYGSINPHNKAAFNYALLKYVTAILNC